MPLTIRLDDQRPCYFGNETIRGRALFDSPSAIAIREIRITFTGRAKAKIQKVKGTGAPAANYRSKCAFFEKEKILLHMNGETLLPGTYEWPFEFLFPSHVQSASRWPEKAPYRSDAHHPLPPTFAVEAGDEARKVSCAIEFRIEAQVLKPQRGFMASRTPLVVEELRLGFIPDVAVSDGDDNEQYSAIYRQSKEQVFNIRSMLLLPENRGRSLNVQQKLQGWLSPGHLPRFSYKVSLSYPTRVVQSMPLVCYLEITPYMEDSSVTTTPEILMQSISITAISQTAARAAPSIMGAISAEIDDRIELLSKTSLHMPVSGAVDLGRVFGPLVLRHTDVSFSTFNIGRTYRLCVTGVFECAGKTNELKLADLPFDVVAKVERDEKKGLGVELPVPVEDAPPVYTPSSMVSMTSGGKA
ncbi:hypothetical protein BDW62DRAFT_179774 [Aspergillus aurantiobrunneus]